MGNPGTESRPFTLIGWTLVGDDGEVPQPVTQALARALTAHGRAVFPCSAVNPRVALWRHAPRHITLFATSDEERVRQVFDDGEYPWSLQGQFALVLNSSTLPPDFRRHRSLLDRLIEPDWFHALDVLAPLGVDAILRPGVDGEVTGLACASAATRADSEVHLTSAAQSLGLTMRLASEREFQMAISTNS